MTTAPELPPAKAAKVAEFDAAPKPPEIAAIAPLLAKLRAVEDEVEAFRDKAEQEFWHGSPELGDLYWRLRRALDAS